MALITLETIRLQAKQRADMENSNFLSTLEWNQNLTNSYKELVDMLVSAYGSNYEVAEPHTFVTDGATKFFPLPETFYKLLGVDIMSGGRGISLKPFNFAERNQVHPKMRYRLNGSKLWLNPMPQSGLTVTLWFVPQPQDLVEDSDTFDGISGWEEYVIVDAAIKALVKEESDITTLAAIKGALIRRIEAMSQNRDAGSPATVSDNSGSGELSHLGESLEGYHGI
jgi:hypothetical protein